MSYEVLARKWRPANFEELVGQEHVQRALINGLDEDRLHHAYLFTGTRGVGKTTIARIFAKSLNCETGVTSKDLRKMVVVPVAKCDTIPADAGENCRMVDAGLTPVAPVLTIITLSPGVKLHEFGAFGVSGLSARQIHLLQHG